MTESGFLFFADVCQSLTIVLSLVAYFPQWRRFYVNKSSANVSLRSWYLWLVGNIFSWIYACTCFVLIGACGMLLVTNTLAITFNIVTLGMIQFYKKKELSEQNLSPALEAVDEARQTVDQLKVVSIFDGVREEEIETQEIWQTGL